MTRRLMLWLTLASAVFWLAGAAIGAAVMHDELNEHFDSALAETAGRLLPLVVDDLYRRDLSDKPYRMGAIDGDEYLSYQVRDRSGRVLMHSYAAPSEPFDVPLVAGFTDTPTHRIYTLMAVSGSIFLQVADPTAHRHEALMEGASTLLLPLTLMAPLNMIAVWWLVRRTLAPVGALQRQIEARSGANLEPLRVVGLPAELENIAASVDKLLARLQAAMDAERRLAANSAHELRTPIAGALAQAQRLAAELPEGPLRERANGIVRALSALAHLAEKLLQLARADAGIGATAKPVDLTRVLRLVADEFQRQPRFATRIRVAIPEGDSFVRKADVDAFAIAVRNLVENALIHGEGEVLIASEQNGFSVTNGGMRIAPDQLKTLLRPFARADSRAPGAGLGLAIADSLTRQMGASLSLVSPAPGRDGGVKATISFGGDSPL
ncbi:MAG: HAMP domain-containing histidine kinase [Rhizobiaceae bacterium]|nr:HAMP domain-containing histidine kinase [Rhizobiaceae bacterium]